MADLEAQRTLVKSPPELWAELSNPASLARRLAEFGEIRITRLIPEKTVAWEGERASGTVELESSGWGTKVRLTATAATPPPAPRGLAPADRITAVIEDDRPPPLPETGSPEAGGPPAGHPETRPHAVVPRGSSAAARSAARMARRAEAAAAEARRAAASVAIPPAPPEPTVTPPAPAPVAAPPAPAPRRGFFARFFARRKTRVQAAPAPPAPMPAPPSPPPPSAQAPATEPSLAAAPPRAARAIPAADLLPTDRDPSPEEPAAVTPAPAPAPRPADRRGARYAPDMPASPPRPARPPAGASGQPDPAVAAPTRQISPPAPAAAPRELDPEQTVALLRSVLDDLGAAHHRPFSRE
ncbi:MAG: hypothetical protein QOE27_701 [Solirubrobacteraceae bacterium]|nr:hypothetical protein [Solirubrobacteraceae bacterium]